MCYNVIMVKVEIIKTKEVKLVSNNEAHGLIEQGVAVLFDEKDKKTKTNKKKDFKMNRQMTRKTVETR